MGLRQVTGNPPLMLLSYLLWRGRSSAGVLGRAVRWFVWQVEPAYESGRERGAESGLVDTGTIDDRSVVHSDLAPAVRLLPRGAPVADGADTGRCDCGGGFSLAPLGFPQNQSPLAGGRSNPFDSDDRDCRARFLYRAASGP